MKPDTPDVHVEDEDIEETDDVVRRDTPPSAAAKPQQKGNVAATDDHIIDIGGPAPAATTSSSMHNGDSQTNNNHTARKSTNHHNTTTTMANENGADVGSGTMGATSRGGGAQSSHNTNQMIGMNGGTSVGTHSTTYHTQNQTGHHHFANNNNINNSNNNNTAGGATIIGQHLRNTDSDDEDFGSSSGVIGGAGGGTVAAGGAGSGTTPGTWGPSRGSNSRAVSPLLNDNMSENSSQAPAMMPGQMVRSKSRPEIIVSSTRYNNTSFWKARRVLFYRNGDPYFPGFEYRFKPTRDITTLEALLEKITPKMDLPRGARYVFSMDGDRKYSLDELEDGASYVLSSFKVFKVSSLFSYLMFLTYFKMFDDLTKVLCLL